MLKKTKKVTTLKKLINFNLNLPLVNKSIFTIEDNGNSIFDYLLLISELQKIKEIKICSFRIAKRDLSFLEELQEKGKLPKIKMILSDSIPSMVVGTFNYLCDNNNFEVEYKNTHAKYCLLETENNFYSIFSSGNFNPDGKLEQLNIINNKEVYNFFLNNN
jgi:hypothetical protein